MAEPKGLRFSANLRFHSILRNSRSICHTDNSGLYCISDHKMFCRSYVNAYICNGAVITPRYGVREDGLAREIFEEVLPGRRVVDAPIPSIAIGGGGIHCITQQEPAV